MRNQQKILSISDIELRILETVEEFGEITPASLSSQVLSDVFRSASGEVIPDPLERATAVLNYLLEERYLFPYFGSRDGQELRNNVGRGLTPKGAERLFQLKHPVLFWLKHNWFPASIAVSTIALSLASIILGVMTSGSGD